ncbi:hypothetical protein DM02DRAFT_30308 [Periconia macrospinosa]|uniref:Uncharacterized protein n=1 Tax=Periconia macrospinosa TaxID=97972 RepID=A0A2V1DLT0_9PLEO|nr:hypothetical protein DM02DRAFT_30308 [Periconia macrospinosa]
MLPNKLPFPSRHSGLDITTGQSRQAQPKETRRMNEIHTPRRDSVHPSEQRPRKRIVNKYPSIPHFPFRIFPLLPTQEACVLDYKLSGCHRVEKIDQGPRMWSGVEPPADDEHCICHFVRMYRTLHKIEPTSSYGHYRKDIAAFQRCTHACARAA